MAFRGKWMELEIIMLSRVNWFIRKKFVCSLSCAESRPNIYIYKHDYSQETIGREEEKE
jgi:hypothetical protein